MLEPLLLIALIVTNAGQFIFWSLMTHRLVNKIMSKDYAQYELSKDGPRPRVRSKEEIELEKEEIEAGERDLNELNAAFGL